MASKDKPKDERIAWQSPKGPNCKKELVTLHQVDVATGKLLAFQKIGPNSAGQYVLVPGALEHAKQLAAMEIYAGKYNLKQIPPEQIGVLPTVWEGMETGEESERTISTLKEALDKAQKENEELQKRLEQLEAAGKDKDKK